ncbi:MAG: fasciclin domain-containing protein [Bacteroidetes bacterium]|nr:fasciclin domain-containing protein [Bacteroidota bacterium]MBS1541216.1 fasciclin domain-containing protein [Bacteroidota bacterium]
MKKAKSILIGGISMAIVFSLWVLSGCTSNSTPAPVPTKNLIDLMSSSAYQQSASVTPDKALDSLVKYISIYPDLVTLLSGTGPYTVFAPSNTAFISLLATPGFPANIKQINPKIIEGVLSYHIVAGQKLQASFTSGLALPTLYTDPVSSAVQNITINSDGTLKTGSTNQAIQIVLGDQKATNGVFDITASVLIPPTVGATLTPILGTVAGTVMLGASFSDLATIIMAADANFAENASTGTFKISTWLAMPVSKPGALTMNSAGITFFATPNAVFAAIAQQQSISEAALITALSTNPDNARALLLNHLVTTGKYNTTGGGSNPTAIQFTNGLNLTTLGKALQIGVSTPGTSTGPYGVTMQNSTPSGAYIAQEIGGLSNGSLEAIAGLLK